MVLLYLWTALAMLLAVPAAGEGGQQARPRPWSDGGSCSGGRPLAAFQLVACRRVNPDTDVLRTGQPEELELLLPDLGGKQLEPVRARTLNGWPQAKGGWEGRLVDDPLSNVSISVAGAAMAAYISTGDGSTYRVWSGRGGMVVERFGNSPTSLWRRLVGEADTGACQEPEEPATPPVCRPGTRSEIRLLVIYTDQALRFAGNAAHLQAWLDLVVSRTNVSFWQSGAELEGTLAEPILVPGYESENTQRDLEALQSGRGPFSELGKWRGDADVVMLVVNNPDYPAKACPFTAEGLTKASFAYSAYAVVPVQQLMLGDNLTHELGHLLGAGHPGDKQTGVFGDSHGYCASATEACPAVQTIMVRDGCPQGAAVLYWSNSSRQAIRGCPLGEAGARDNTRALNATGCIVAGYR